MTAPRRARSTLFNERLQLAQPNRTSFDRSLTDSRRSHRTLFICWTAKRRRVWLARKRSFCRSIMTPRFGAFAINGWPSERGRCGGKRLAVETDHVCRNQVEKRSITHAVEQGPARRPEASLAAERGLGHSCPASDEAPQTRSGALQSRYRQQVTRLRSR